MSEHMTPARKYAAAQSETLVPRMIAAIDAVHRNTTWIARGALAITTPHQVLFLGGFAHGSIGDQVAAWLFALLIPAVGDLGMLSMLRVTQTAGMNRTARRRAMLVLLALVAQSATVNFLAPGAMVFRVLVAAAAVTLAAIEWVSSAMAPDFTEFESAEAELATHAAPAVDETAEAAKAARRERDRQRRAARKATAEAQAAAAEIQAAQRRERAAERRRLTRQVSDLEAAFQAADAPVSPTPYL